jgi:hypothetical protein
MGKSTNIAGLKLIHDHEKPIFIRGTPDRLQATLQMKNDSESKMTLKSMPIQASKLRSESREPLNEVRVFGRLYPHQQGKVQIEFPIDPTTPPGTYEGTVQVGEQIQAAQIDIDEYFELDVEPDTVTLHIDKTLKFERDFVFTNLGNVAITLGNKFTVPLKTGGGLEYLLQMGLREVCTGKKHKQYDPLHDRKGSRKPELSELLCSIADLTAAPARISWENVNLESGETRVVKGSIELPGNMQPNHRYVAELELYSASIILDIYTRG